MLHTFTYSAVILGNMLFVHHFLFSKLNAAVKEGPLRFYKAIKNPLRLAGNFFNPKPLKNCGQGSNIGVYLQLNFLFLSVFLPVGI